MLASIILTFHVLLALALVILVLIQHGKGADMGAAFGTGSAGSLFGSSGAANFLSRSTGVCATLFFLTSLALTYNHAPGNKGLTTGIGDSVTIQKDAKKDAADAIPAPPSNSVPAPAIVPTAPASPPPAPQQIPK